MKKWLPVLMLALVLIPFQGEAQCAMCKAVVESSQSGGSSVADGLNSGILYLMAFPYLILGGIGFAIYKHRKQRSQ